MIHVEIFFDLLFSRHTIATIICSEAEVAVVIEHSFPPLCDATSIKELKEEGSATAAPAATGVSREMG